MPDVKFSNQYPYTDFHELNLDWVIKEVKYWSTKVGKTIQSIELTGTVGLVDTYTINYSDGTTSTFDVTNGNGISSVAKTGTVGLVDTYTITFQDGSTSTFDVTNGAAAVDPTLTLSDYAADAKATGDRIIDVYDIANSNREKLDNLWHTFNYYSSAGYLKSDNTINMDMSAHCLYTDKTPCHENQVFKYKGVGQYVAVSYIMFLNDTIVTSGQINDPASYTNIIIPSGVNFIKFASFAAIADPVILDVVIVSELTPDDQQQIQQNIGLVADTLVEKTSELGTNLFDPTDVVSGEFLNGGGNITSYGPAYHSTAIYLPAGSYLINCRVDFYGANGAVVYICDMSGVYQETVYATIIRSAGNDSIMLLTLSSDCKIMFNILNPDDTMIVRGTTESDFPSIYIPYDPDKMVFESDVYLSTDLKNEVELIAVKNGLYKKMIAADGDSISYGNGYIGGYAKVISENNKMTYQNLSVGGATIVSGTYNGGNPRHWICQSMPSLSNDADYILIEGGINDASLSVPLGSITPGYTDAFDDSTFYGALETIFKTLTTQFAGKKYVFIIPHGILAAMVGSGTYHAAIIACAEKWGVPVIDLTLTVPPFNFFRGDATVDNIRSIYTTSGDGWHPSELCYREYYAPQIEGFLLTL